MVRHNRNQNPTFDNDTAGWTATRTKAALRRVLSTRGDGARGYIGDAYTSGTGTSIVQNTSAAVAPVVPGQTYTATIYVFHGAGTTKNIRVDADEYSASLDYVSTWATGNTVGPNIAVPTNTWTRVTQTGTVSPGVALLGTYVLFSIGQDNTYIAVSCAMVEDGPSSPNYRDGNSAGWEWAGIPGSSQSQELSGPEPGRMLLAT